MEHCKFFNYNKFEQLRNILKTKIRKVCKKNLRSKSQLDLCTTEWGNLRVDVHQGKKEIEINGIFSSNTFEHEWSEVKKSSNVTNETEM